MTGLVAVIPALNPQKTLLPFVQQLYKLGFQQVVLIDDGSDTKYEMIFEGLAQLPFCHVLKNAKNKGKGFSLKRGFKYSLDHFPYCEGMITIGAHGQHRLQDIQLMMKMTKIFSNSFIIGIRNMKSADIPFNQYIEYRFSMVLFHLLYHKRLLDVQSGLRYIPKEKVPWLLRVEGDGFDYDLNMLVEAIRHQYPIYEIEIGQARFKKNSLLHYDEAMSMRKLMLDMLVNYFKGTRR